MVFVGVPVVELSADYSDESFMQKTDSEGDIKEEPSDDPFYTCSLCMARNFNKKDDLLFHLCVSHFSKQLNSEFPYKESTPCPLCGGFQANNMSAHITHVGIRHEQVLKFLPGDLIAVLSKTKTQPNQIPENEWNHDKHSVEKIRSENQETNDNSIHGKVELKPNSEYPEIKFQSKSRAREQSANDGLSNREKVTCNICPTTNQKERIFSKRSDYLKHLSLAHFGKPILTAHPFVQGQGCVMCMDEKQREYIPSKKEIHVCHVGLFHRKLLSLLPEKLVQQVKKLPGKTKQEEPFPSAVTSNNGSEMPAGKHLGMEKGMETQTKAEIPYQCRYCPNKYSEQRELKKHLVSHKAELRQDNS